MLLVDTVTWIIKLITYIGFWEGIMDTVKENINIFLASLHK